MRPRPFFHLLALWTLVITPGCVGSYTPSSSGPGADVDARLPPLPGVDAAPGSADAALAAAADASIPSCLAAQPSPGSGHHNPGTSCANCHDGAQAPLWTIGGTLYADSAGAAPLAGATIVITDAAGATIPLITSANGNFWTSQSVTFPIHVAASRCPNVAPMAGAVVAPASCNGSGCHDSQLRMHLP